MYFWPVSRLWLSMRARTPRAIRPSASACSEAPENGRGMPSGASTTSRPDLDHDLDLDRLVVSPGEERRHVLHLADLDAAEGHGRARVEAAHRAGEEDREMRLGLEPVARAQQHDRRQHERDRPQHERADRAVDVSSGSQPPPFQERPHLGLVAVASAPRVVPGRSWSCAPRRGTRHCLPARRCWAARGSPARSSCPRCRAARGSGRRAAASSADRGPPRARRSRGSPGRAPSRARGPRACACRR